MSERTAHSKLAIASTILPLAVWLYLALMYLLVFKCEPCAGFVNRIMGDSFGALGVAAIVFIILFGIIPFGGHIAGLICGIIGFFSKDKKRLFAVIGLILNALPLFAYSIYRVFNAFKVK